jgi:hypothetical protein
MAPTCHRCAKGAADDDNQNQDPSRQRSYGRQHLARTYADPSDGCKGASTNVRRLALGGPRRAPELRGADPTKMAQRRAI